MVLFAKILKVEQDQELKAWMIASNPSGDPKTGPRDLLKEETTSLYRRGHPFSDKIRLCFPPPSLTFIHSFFPFYLLPGCPMENLLRHSRSRAAKSFVDDDKTADELLKKLPPYRPPGSSSDLELKELSDPLDVMMEPQAIPPLGPYFDLRRTRNVTALKGITTNLICRVKRLGDHKVRDHPS